MESLRLFIRSVVESHVESLITWLWIGLWFTLKTPFTTVGMGPAPSSFLPGSWRLGLPSEWVEVCSSWVFDGDFFLCCPLTLYEYWNIFHVIHSNTFNSTLQKTKLNRTHFYIHMAMYITASDTHAQYITQHWSCINCKHFSEKYMQSCLPIRPKSRYQLCHILPSAHIYHFGCDWNDFRKISFIVDSNIPMQIEGIVAFPWQQWLPERAKMSCYISLSL